MHGRFFTALVLDAGVGFVPEDRTEDGLVGEFTIAENLMLDRSDRKPFAKGLNLQLGLLKTFAEEKLKQFDIRAQGINSKASQLSGGNQQKSVIGRWMAVGPALLLLDEPTRGVDVSARAEIHAEIRRLADSGSSVLFASSELEEVLMLADRVIVMHDGSIAGELAAHEATEVAIMHLATGGKPAAAHSTAHEHGTEHRTSS